MIEIEKGVPIPPKFGKGMSIYPLHVMEVGDSFRIPDGKLGSVLSLCRRQKGKFSVRKTKVPEPDGWRGWRVWRVS